MLCICTFVHGWILVELCLRHSVWLKLYTFELKLLGPWLNDSVSQLVLDVFTWIFFFFWKLFLARRLCANLIWNILNLFTEKNISNERHIKTQCILPDEEGKCQKHHFRGMKIWYFTPLFIWGFEISLQIVYPFIKLMHKRHKINLHCPKCMFKGKLLMRKCWFRPLIHLTV